MAGDRNARATLPGRRNGRLSMGAHCHTGRRYKSSILQQQLKPVLEQESAAILQEQRRTRARPRVEVCPDNRDGAGVQEDRDRGDKIRPGDRNGPGIEGDTNRCRQIIAGNRDGADVQSWRDRSREVGTGDGNRTSVEGWPDRSGEIIAGNRNSAGVQASRCWAAAHPPLKPELEPILEQESAVVLQHQRTRRERRDVSAGDRDSASVQADGV